ncbi:Carbamoyl-phosphate synthase L chain, ATP-binding [Desulfurococcus amylolyticus 1221n]|uniref:Carbamoyl-phosphate synthase L chain, ATP-binding n=1 Tax=Desulfurococcus amylolyticus (strain DSM 18924 / JCM 16383 / VKM B-2413 / 1221n) TaxID=490899 RepID=B8D4C5_DESA1|nr:biotin carboxylase N-terminal domain-containing protein [Desulfurococcus amylolyticus]ACL10956.1 Carbamoyl-phosphate synthase L chain, ATP-binding [Desulfurococcus amylolyticus 1221n]
MSRRILIANKGEVAVRIARTLIEKGYHPLGVYVSNDELSPHRRYMVEEAKISSYTNAEEIIEAALELGAEAIHPGYGLLESEPGFSQEVARRGLIFVGPPPGQIEFARDKLAVKTLAEKLEIPTLPWSLVKNEEDLEEFVRTYGYPLILKPVKGNWGRGLRILWSEKDRDQLKTLIKEAEKIYRDSRIYVEPYITNVKHIEIQLIGDGEKVIHLYDRECSIQDNYMKILVEAPSTLQVNGLREKILNYALSIGEAMRLRNLATIEFLYDARSRSVFLNEVNMGLSPEHAVTEAVTRIDLVEKQVEAALYSTIGLKQENVSLNGWAFQAKVFNKNIFRDEPSSGLIKTYNEPNGLGVACDTGIAPGVKVRDEYTLLVKVLAWGSSRLIALNRLKRALNDIYINGVHTNIPVLREILDSKDVENGIYNTRFLVEKRDEIISKLRERMLLHAIASISLIEYGSKEARKILGEGKLSTEKIMENASRTKRTAWFYYARLRERIRRK